MAKKPIRREEIDEALIINLIGGVDAPPRLVPKSSPAASLPETPPTELRDPPTENPDSAATPPVKVKKDRENTKSEFERLFLKARTCQPQTTCRIAKETSDKLSIIVRMLGGNEMSLKTYVNNILDAHLEQYRDEINNLINNAKNIKL